MSILSPLLWRLLPWGLLAVAGLLDWALWNQLGMVKLRRANAQDVIRVREDDARRSAEAIAKLSDVLTRSEAKVITVTEKIYAAPITRNCGDSLSIRAGRVGVRELIAPGGQAPAGREPPAAVQRPRSGAGQRQRQRHRGRAGAGGAGLRHLPGKAQSAGRVGMPLDPFGILLCASFGERHAAAGHGPVASPWQKAPCNNPWRPFVSTKEFVRVASRHQKLGAEL